MSTNIALPDNLTITCIQDAYAELNSAFSEAKDTIVLDGENTDTIDSTGLQMLLKLIQDAQNNDVKVTWSNCHESLKSGAAQIGLVDHLQIPE